MMAPVPWVIMLKKVRPVDCKMRSNIISPKIPKLNTQQICRYWVPMRMISGLSVWLLKKISAPKIPNTAKAANPRTASNTPLTAAKSAFSWFFSPRERDNRALTPTQVPADTAMIRFWTGKAMETAVRAAWLIMDTKMLSTMLYMACTSMEMTIGSDIVTSSLFMGMVPILFSCAINLVTPLFL